MTKEIPLTRGLVALVDDEDYPIVAAHSWYAAPRRRHPGAFDATRRFKEKGISRRQCIHHLLLPTRRGLVTDHANGNTLDYRRTNLRYATVAQNVFNAALRHDNACGFKGVSVCRNRWRAKVTVGGRTYSLGVFATPEEAARVYDAAASDAFGNFARLNFPEGI